MHFQILGVADGARTHDNRNHNPGLYQLSYSHRISVIIASIQTASARYCVLVVSVAPLPTTGLGTRISALKRAFITL